MNFFFSKYGSIITKPKKNRKKPIKNLIMDNALVVGVGNIYASEALFRAGIKPTARAAKISKTRLKRLHSEIRNVLQDAIASGGSTILNFSSVNGQEGYFARALNVYGKTGEQCGKCKKTSIKLTVMSGRSTYHCPYCQR